MRWCLALALLASTVALADPPASKEFAYGIELTTERADGLHSLTLDEAVLRASAAPDLRDLRVFNGNGDAMPIARLPAPPPPEPTRGPLTTLLMVPLPPAEKDQERALAQYAVRLERDGQRTLLEVVPGDSSAPQAAVEPGGYLVDLRPLKDKAGELSLEFAPDAPDYARRVQVLGSDNLVDWRSLTTGVLAHNQALGEAAERATFSVSRPPAFGRISWSGGTAPRLKAASFVEEMPPAAVPLPRTPLALVASNDGGWLVELPIGLPVTRIAIHAPEINQSLRVDLHCPTDPSGRRTRVPNLRELAVREAPSPWFVCAAGVEVYKADRGGEPIENAPIALPYRTTQFRLEVVNPKDYRGAPPVVEAEWTPVRIAFLARAPGPYRLAVGRADADAGPRLDLAPLLASDDPSGAKLPVAMAPNEPGAVTGGAAATSGARQAAMQWRIALWAVLLLAVGAIAAMAWRLARQIKNPDPGQGA